MLLKTPPDGLVRMLYTGEVRHKTGILEMLGVTGFATVTLMVLVSAQLTTEGVTATV